MFISGFLRAQTFVVGINKMDEDVTRYQKMAGENLSDTIMRGILMKALTNEAELQKHVFRNSTRLCTYEKMGEEVMSALTAERAVHEPIGDDPMEIGAVGKREKRAQARKEKVRTTRRVGERAQARDQAPGHRTPMQIEGAPTANTRANQRGMQDSYGRRKGQQEQGREKQEKGQTIQAKGEETSECVGRSRTRKSRNEQQQHQLRRGPGHCLRVTSTHDLRSQSHARLDSQFQ